MSYTKETLANGNRAIFGPSSEKRPRTDAPAKTKDATAKRGHGPSEQPELPIVEVVHELDEPDKVCPSCGGQLAEMDGQFEEADEIEIVERSFQITRHERKKYSCKCGGCVDTALGPPELIPGGRYSMGFATAVAIAKYTDHMPLA